jgi:hypothetical protein
VPHPQDTADGEPATSEEEQEALEEIDEVSEDEDDRRAHELLRTPVPVEDTRGGSPATLPYNNYTFAVSFIYSL